MPFGSFSVSLCEQILYTKDRPEQRTHTETFIIYKSSPIYTMWGKASHVWGHLNRWHGTDKYYVRVVRPSEAHQILRFRCRGGWETLTHTYSTYDIMSIFYNTDTELSLWAVTPFKLCVKLNYHSYRFFFLFKEYVNELVQPFIFPSVVWMCVLTAAFNDLIVFLYRVIE